MPQPSYGELFGIGIKYLKVNRFDSGGLDRSDYLGQLTNLTINYDDLGPIQYNITTIQEQDTYFVYGIQTKNQSTSSVNYNIISQSVEVERTGSTSITDELQILGWFGDLGIEPGFNNILSGNSDVMGGIPGNYSPFILFRTPNTELSLILTGSYNSFSPKTTNVRFFFCQPNDDTGASNATFITSSVISTSTGILQLK